MTQKFVDKAVLEQMRIWIYIRKPHLMDGETILTATAAVTPSGLTLVGDCVISGGRVEQVVNGGVAGVSYLVQFTITTSGGDTFCNPDYEAIIVRVT
jgi:hypothetical protein